MQSDLLPGIDTIRLSVPITSHDLASLPTARLDLRKGDGDAIWSGQAKASLAGGVRVRSQGGQATGLRLVVEAELGSLLYGHNALTVPARDAQEVITTRIVPPIDEVSDGARWEDAVVTRLDTTSDLRCDPDLIGPTMRAASAVPGPARTTSKMYWNGRTPSYFQVWNGGGGVKVYDLLAQKLQKGVPRAVLAGIPPSIRVETTNWKGWLGTYRLRHLYDLFAEPQNVGELHRRRLHWAHFDTSITASSSAGLQSLLDAVRTTRSESTPREITTMIGFVVAEAMDLPCGLGKATKAKYRRAVEEAGVRIVPEITTASAAVAIRLNFDGGRVETVPAR